MHKQHPSFITNSNVMPKQHENIHTFFLGLTQRENQISLDLLFCTEAMAASWGFHLYSHLIIERFVVVY